MRKLLTNLRDVAMAGLFFLLPIYVPLILAARAWTPLSSRGTKVAAVFGMDSVLGVAGSTVFAALLLLITWIACGLLVRFSFVAAFGRATEGWLSKNIPGYAVYKSLAEDKLHQGAKRLPVAAALIRLHGFWQPAFVFERDTTGNLRGVSFPTNPTPARAMFCSRSKTRFGSCHL